jgi:hypothetical protein
LKAAIELRLRRKIKRPTPRERSVLQRALRCGASFASRRRSRLGESFASGVRSPRRSGRIGCSRYLARSAHQAPRGLPTGLRFSAALALSNAAIVSQHLCGGLSVASTSRSHAAILVTYRRSSDLASAIAGLGRARRMTGRTDPAKLRRRRPRAALAAAFFRSPKGPSKSWRGSSPSRLGMQHYRPR